MQVEGMFDIISVGVIVGTAFFLAARSIYKTATGKGSGCGNCDGKSCGSGEVTILDKMNE